jgi:hypothetical protein
MKQINAKTIAASMSDAILTTTVLPNAKGKYSVSSIIDQLLGVAHVAGHKQLRECQEMHERRNHATAVVAKLKPPTDKAGMVANAERVLEITEIGLDDDGEDELTDVTALAQRVINLCCESKSTIPQPIVVKAYNRMSDWVCAVLLDYRSDLYLEASKGLKADRIRVMKIRRK